MSPSHQTDGARGIQRQLLVQSIDERGEDVWSGYMERYADPFNASPYLLHCSCPGATITPEISGDIYPKQLPRNRRSKSKNPSPVTKKGILEVTCRTKTKEKHDVE
ncbi:hypothetical protein PHLCEN_2v1241 [Hermanssonia centrifuga]|uniref:Uncharacterized protein n=1 Tax=Hermanssonia centrifuga TaxID=98765 RepID=A0A2R6S3T8_9APHY|nr:hypothetical protein PHLCEN_2v1241 [Hermanssonia centrifuga]